MTSPSTGAPPPPLLNRVKRQRKRKSILMPKTDKAARERNRFNGFEVKKTVEYAKGKTMVVKEVISPETGIHSLEWARKVTPQAIPLFRIPLEVRMTIYQLALAYYDELQPRKHLKRFVPTWREPDSHPRIKTYLSLSLVSRQTYIEVVGSSLLYKTARFKFLTPNQMTNYITRINPSHRSSIRSVDLEFKLDPKTDNIPRPAIRGLLTMPALQDLSLTIIIDQKKYTLGQVMPGWDKKAQNTLNPALLINIAEEKNWTGLRGLKKFKMKFSDVFGWHFVDQETELANLVRGIVCQRE